MGSNAVSPKDGEKRGASSILGSKVGAIANSVRTSRRIVNTIFGDGVAVT